MTSSHSSAHYHAVSQLHSRCPLSAPGPLAHAAPSPGTSKGTSRTLGRVLLGCALFAATLISLGCSARTRPVSLEATEAHYHSRDYTRVLEHWTRQRRLNTLEELDNVLTVTSTYQSLDFRHAYAARYADDYELSTSERSAFLDRSLDAARNHHEFFVALYAQRPRWGDLDEAAPLWVVRLVDGKGTVTKASSIDKVRKPSALEQTYYPYVSSHRKVFRLTFPRYDAAGAPTIDPKSEWFGLQFSGAQGKMTLEWRLQSAE